MINLLEDRRRFKKETNNDIYINIEKASSVLLDI